MVLLSILTKIFIYTNRDTSWTAIFLKLPYRNAILPVFASPFQFFKVISRHRFVLSIMFASFKANIIDMKTIQIEIHLFFSSPKSEKQFDLYNKLASPPQHQNLEGPPPLNQGCHERFLL